MVLKYLVVATPQNHDKNHSIDISRTQKIACHQLLYDGRHTPALPYYGSYRVTFHNLNTKISYTMHSTETPLGYIGIGIEHLYWS